MFVEHMVAPSWHASFSACTFLSATQGSVITNSCFLRESSQTTQTDKVWVEIAVKRDTKKKKKSYLINTQSDAHSTQLYK